MPTDRPTSPSRPRDHDSANKPDPFIPPSPDDEDHQEALIDEAVMETFPASDPISPKMPNDDKPHHDAPSPAPR